MMGTSVTTTIVVEGMEGDPLTMVGVGVKGLQYLSDLTQYSYLYDHKYGRWRCVYHV
jgi:hypothetical protein